MSEELPNRIAILVPSFSPEDAIATHVEELRAVLLGQSVEIAVFADEIKPDSPSFVLPAAEFLRSRNDPHRLTLYQCATNSNLYRYLIERTEVLAVQYHNVTPRAEFFNWDTGISLAVAWGRRQMSALSRYAAIGLALSEFNANELKREGYRRVALSPPLIRSLPSELPRRSYQAKRHEALFVGRLAPNKAHEELLGTLAIYNATFEPRLHLTLVGSDTVPSYVMALHNLVDALDLANDVTFRSGLSRQELADAYGAAHIFVSASRHEGFGFPLIEAMRVGLPVAAVDSSAVGETVGDAGITYTSGEGVVAATAWSIILHDAFLRRTLVSRGKKRAREFDLLRTSRENLAALAHVLALPQVAPAPLWYDSSAKTGAWR